MERFPFCQRHQLPITPRLAVGLAATEQITLAAHSDLSKQKSARTRRAYPEITNDMAAVLQPENGAVLLDGRDPAKEVRLL